MNTTITAPIAATTGNVYSNYRFALKAIIITCLLKQHTNGTVPEKACSFQICWGCLNPGMCKHVSRNLNVTSDGIIGEH